MATELDLASLSRFVLRGMAPLSQALQVAPESKADDGTVTYRCDLDPTWTVVAVPHGGYTLGVILESCIRYQSTSPHPDPVHVTAHYLRATNVGTGHVRVKMLKSGKTFSNLVAELVQQGTTKITAHLIFGDLSPSQPGQESVLAPPSPYARRVPLHEHPSTQHGVEVPWANQMEAQIAVDAVLLHRNDPSSSARTTSESVGGGGIEWGAWCELTHKDDHLTASSIPYFCDSFLNLPLLLPESEPGSAGRKKRWFPTITMSIEFKARIPSPDNHSSRTVGLFCESRFLNHPNSRHNARVEIWTAPSDIGRGDIAADWRDRQYCIAVADQMALMLSVELNMRQGVKDSTKL